MAPLGQTMGGTLPADSTFVPSGPGDQMVQSRPLFEKSLAAEVEFVAAHVGTLAHDQSLRACSELVECELAASTPPRDFAAQLDAADGDSDASDPMGTIRPAQGTLQGTQAQALDVLRAAAPHKAATSRKPLAESMVSLRGHSDFVALPEEEIEGEAELLGSSVKSSDSKAKSQTLVGIASVSRPAALAEDFYEDDDVEVDEEIDERPTPASSVQTPLSDASGLADSLAENSLGYSLSGASALGSGASALGISGSGRTSPAPRVRPKSAPRGSGIVRPGGGHELSPLDEDVAEFSLTEEPSLHLPEDRSVQEDSLDYSITYCAPASVPFPSSDAGDSASTKASTNDGEGTPQTGGKAGVDTKKLEQFMSAVQGADGLGQTMQGDLMNLLKEMR